MAANKAEVRMTPEVVQEAFKNWVAADRIFDLAKKRKEAEAGQIKPELLRIFAQHLWEKHAAPKHSPRYAVADEAGRIDLSAIFQVQKRFSFNLSERADQDNLSIEYRVAADLTEFAGMSIEKATQLVEQELHTYPGLPVNVHELIYGRYNENGDWHEATDIQRDAGQKLLQFIMAETDGDLPQPLTVPERGAVKEYEKEMYRIKPGFFERLYQYIEIPEGVEPDKYVEGPEKIYEILKILNPTHFCSHAKLGESQTPQARVNRYETEAVKLVKASTGEIK